MSSKCSRKKKTDRAVDNGRSGAVWVPENWIQNDTYRSAGDAAYGMILEITFMWLMIIPAVCLAGLVWKLPFWMIFICCYIDEPIRFCLMQYHMYTGRWIKPVTEQGRLALVDFQKK